MISNTKMTEAEITKVFLTSLHHAGVHDYPYRHWLLNHCLPEEVVDEIVTLPIEPTYIGDTLGRRETHNDTRTHFGVENCDLHPVMNMLANVFQTQEIVDALKTCTRAPIEGTLLRIEYCQDTEDFWLEPHTDIGAKRFSMLLYLNREPEGMDWGTDIYADKNTHVGRVPSGFNAGMIFVPSDKTWHGFEKRPVQGVRKSLIINYVGPEWRARHELCFPDDPV